MDTVKRPHQAHEALRVLHAIKGHVRRDLGQRDRQRAAATVGPALRQHTECADRVVYIGVGFGRGLQLRFRGLDTSGSEGAKERLGFTVLRNPGCPVA
jgi:hypothetical protein